MRIYAGSKLTASDVIEAVVLTRSGRRKDIYLDDLETTPRGALVFHCAANSGPRATNRRQGAGGEDRAASWTAWGYMIAELFRRDPNARIGQYKNVDDFRRQCQEYGPYRARYHDTLDFLDLVVGIHANEPTGVAS